MEHESFFKKNPYISDVDRNTILGRLVWEYGQTQWREAYTVGFLSGIFSGMILCGVYLRFHK